MALRPRCASAARTLGRHRRSLKRVEPPAGRVACSRAQVLRLDYVTERLGCSARKVGALVALRGSSASAVADGRCSAYEVTAMSAVAREIRQRVPRDHVAVEVCGRPWPARERPGLEADEPEVARPPLRPLE